jgi:plastocyanin
MGRRFSIARVVAAPEYMSLCSYRQNLAEAEGAGTGPQWENLHKRAMKMRMRSSIAVVALSVTAMLAIVLPGSAQAVVAAAGPGSFAGTYATPVVFTRVGGPLTFVNGDVASHTLTASDAYLPRRVARRTGRCANYSARRCPLFATGSVGSGESEDVAGLKRVKAGKQYAFRCEIHSSMKGTLVVAP